MEISVVANLIKLFVLFGILIFVAEYKFSLCVNASLDRMQVSAFVKLFKWRILTVLFSKELKFRILSFKFHEIGGKNRKKALKSQKTDKNGDRINKSRDKAHKKGNKNNTNVALILELLSAVKVLSVSQVGSFGTNDAAISGMGSGGFFGIMTLLGFLTDGFESFIPAWEDEFSLSAEIKIGVRPIDLAARFLQFKKKEKKKSRRFESVKPLKKLQNNV